MVHKTHPVTVKAPIITDGLIQEGVQPLLDYVASIETHSNTEMFAEETKRLKPYFSALSIYLTHALKNADPVSMTPQEQETLKGLITPGKLKAAFNKMAACTRNTLISDFVIMPEAIKQGPAAHLFGEVQFDPKISYGKSYFTFSFLQIFERGDRRSSTTIPTLTLDTRLMDEIAPYQPTELYRRLQLILTDMNHDMLHHLHSPFINNSIAHNFLGSGTESRAPDMMKWRKSLAEGRLEEWSQVSHGKMYMTPQNARLVKEVSENLDACFDELARITKALPKDRAHEIADYFGTLVAHTLSRTFPFNHPLMARCLEHMRAIDPLSEAELLEDAFKKYGKLIGDYLSSSSKIREHLKWLGESRMVLGATRDIVSGYRQQELDLLPHNDSAMSFKNVKLLQLAAIEPNEMRVHVPSPANPDDQKVRSDSDRAFLDLIRAVAKTTANSPR